MRRIIRFNPVSTLCADRYIAWIPVFVLDERDILYVVKCEELAAHFDGVFKPFFTRGIAHIALELVA